MLFIRVRSQFPIFETGLKCLFCLLVNFYYIVNKYIKAGFYKPAFFYLGIYFKLSDNKLINKTLNNTATGVYLYGEGTYFLLAVFVNINLKTYTSIFNVRYRKLNNNEI